jgi:biopolymer transport protein ExbD
MKLPSPIRRKRSRIEIIPLIDIMFFLLASFMMVSLQLDQAKNIRVNLPPAAEAQHDFKPDMINIAVDKAGTAWLEQKPLSLAGLGRAVGARYQGNTNLPVYISGDRDTLHGAMVDVLAAVRNAGVQNVAFLVDGQPDPAAP